VGPKIVSAVWRLGTQADMAGAAQFLAPLAYIVGQTIVVGGGPDTLSFGTGSGLAAGYLSKETSYLSKETRSDRDGQGSDCRFGQGFRR
jgi:hypothetical protein